MTETAPKFPGEVLSPGMLVDTVLLIHSHSSVEFFFLGQVSFLDIAQQPQKCDLPLPVSHIPAAHWPWPLGLAPVLLLQDLLAHCLPL